MITPSKVSARTLPSSRLLLAGLALALGVGLTALLLARPRPALNAAERASAPNEANAAPATSNGPQGSAEATSPQAVKMSFPDGSEIALIAGARGRLANMSEHGGRVILEDGSARVSIVNRPSMAWVIEAGPSSILTTGAVMLVRWSKAEDALDVRLVEGSATVRGPASPDGAALRAGDELIVEGRDSRRVASAPEPQD